ncbi:glutathione S-transferase family protein [Pseudomonas putida]|uniref:Glutathione S-transferase family protein n=1 Tax=Pseudomonas putida TaxID=303 RepID=A0A8I1JM19_PSEPU|nr:glutathione S-transferase family protein [Pseudomonas putida]MBI6885025.1 glutathione S-transferase family protein [Pseudomonas putida]
MPRTLYGHLKSSNVMKSLWLMDELGLDYERIDKGNVFGGLDTDEYKRMNPTSLVPTLVDGDFTVWESNAILRYLCNRYAPDSSLYPAEATKRAVVDQWLDCQQTQLTRPQTVVFFQLIRTPADKRDNAALDQAIQQAGQVWMWIEKRLGENTYLCGDDFTIADIAWAVHAHRWLNMDFTRPAHPNLTRWYQQLLQHDSFRLNWGGPVV